MAEAEENRSINQEKEEQQEKAEVLVQADEGEQSKGEASSEEATAEEETKETAGEEENPAEEETIAEEETVEEPKIKIEDVKTAPADFRFPTTNQTRHCFTRYIEYHKCIAAKGEGSSECDKFAKYYRALCPGEWIERWNEQRENGTFPGPL